MEMITEIVKIEFGYNVNNDECIRSAKTRITNKYPDMKVKFEGSPTVKKDGKIAEVTVHFHLIPK